VHQYEEVLALNEAMHLLPQQGARAPIRAEEQIDGARAFPSGGLTSFISNMYA
jgi:hypothetical protein